MEHRQKQLLASLVTRRIEYSHCKWVHVTEKPFYVNVIRVVRFTWSWPGRCCKHKKDLSFHNRGTQRFLGRTIFWPNRKFLCDCQLGRKGNAEDRIMSTTNFSSGKSHTKSYEELLCSPSLVGGLQQQLSICFVAVDILLSITAFVGNSLILVSLYKESSLHPPSKLLYRCLATADLLVGLVAQPLNALYWLSVVQEHWSLCQYAFDAANITAYVLLLVSLMTMTAISVDRLLALMLGLRYKQIVTLKRAYIIVTTFWVFTLVASLSEFFYHRIFFMYSSLVISFCLVISFASYTKIFCTLRYHQAQVRDQQQPSQTNALNMARFRKAVYSALWVQLALVVCYVPGYTVGIVIALTKKYSLPLVVTWSMAATLLYFNSTLNPFLYCWKISEVRQAVKQTIREALCWVRFSSSSSDF